MKQWVSEALKKAKSQLGVREEGENRGPRVNAYLATVGLTEGNPWCAAFVYWCVREAAGDPETVPFVRTGYCPAMAAWAREHDLLEGTPQPGDVFLSYGRVQGIYRACHTGFVTEVQGSVFCTIEGNTNLDGSREGIGVFARRRTNGDRYRFVRWERLVQEGPEAPAPTYTLFLNDKPVVDEAGKPVQMPLGNGRALCPVRAWGKALGFEVGWNQEEQVPLFDGREVATEIVLVGQTAYAPIRDLVESAGLKLKLDAAARQVKVTR